MVLGNLTVAQDSGQGRVLGWREILAGHFLLEAQRRALMGAPYDMSRVQVKVVSGRSVAGQRFIATQLLVGRLPLGLPCVVGHRHGVNELLAGLFSVLPCNQAATLVFSTNAPSRKARTTLAALLTTPKWVAMS